MAERVESYNSAVAETERAVKEIQEEIFTSVFDSIVNFVSTAAAQAGQLIPTAVLLTGVREANITSQCILTENLAGEHAGPLQHLLSAPLQAGVGLPPHLPCCTWPQPPLPCHTGFSLQLENFYGVHACDRYCFRLCQTLPLTRMRRL